MGEWSIYFMWLKDGFGFMVLEKWEIVLDVKDEDSEKSGIDVFSDVVGENELLVFGFDIVFYKLDSMGRKVLVNFENFIFEGEEKFISIECYSWFEDGKWLLVFMNG